MTREELLKVAHGRLYPSLFNPNYLVLQSRRRIFTRAIAGLGENLSVLDIGARYQPYRPLFAGKVAKYITFDIQRTKLVDVVASGEQIPFKDETFDVAIATQVFEYFRRPHIAAGEVRRTLKSGGVLLMSVAQVVPRTGDEECWRYTPNGIRSVLAEFQKIEIFPEVNSVASMCRLANIGMGDLLKLRPLKLAYSATICPIVNLLGLASAKLTDNDTWSGNYSVIATK